MLDQKSAIKILLFVPLLYAVLFVLIEYYPNFAFGWWFGWASVFWIPPSPEVGWIGIGFAVYWIFIVPFWWLGAVIYFCYRNE